ncbi:hypothetical protein DUNSADRAFT_14877 [Dunaliella salina]|uniref:Encoded protein n=1 Tax=Dunaliella salina TaxID=3046 RepID=A0ABQ7G6J9_DUNSA|nr:hypothetical protein DUNSADRAFT_14877 [Dunaliella salina]|eukprot:KAF5830235.1 hypothetical protein DUNSADRAFT_14877 [Dunaliella salina]
MRTHDDHNSNSPTSQSLNGLPWTEGKPGRQQLSNPNNMISKAHADTNYVTNIRKELDKQKGTLHKEMAIVQKKKKQFHHSMPHGRDAALFPAVLH